MEQNSFGWHQGGANQPQLEMVWEQISALLKERVGGLLYERWLTDLELRSLQENKVVFGVRSIMHECWLLDNCMSVLQDVLMEVLGRACEVEFAVPTEAETRKSKPVPHVEAARSMESAPAVREVVEMTPGPLFNGDHKLSKLIGTAGLNHRYSFDTFVEGPNCSYSYAVARAVAEKPGKTYNPLFLHGPVGLGKTHLMQAIGQEILRTKSRKVVRYVTSESFTNEYIDALRHGTVTDFRKKYRKVDVLLIDDIQFFVGKGSTQEEFFHTFNDLFNNFKQIVLTSDRAPSEIRNLESRLVSRFEWGMTTQIESPDLETRMAILRQKTSYWSMKMDEWVLTFLAENIRTNVRRLEGALMRVAAHISLNSGTPLTPEVLEGLLRDILEESDSKAITIDLIQKVVAEHFDIRLADMTGKRRPAAIAGPRQMAMYLARELTKSSLVDIGEAFGGRDHGTVIHACKAVAKRLEQKEDLRRVVGQLTEKIKRMG